MFVCSSFLPLLSSLLLSRRVGPFWKVCDGYVTTLASVGSFPTGVHLDEARGTLHITTARCGRRRHDMAPYDVMDASTWTRRTARCTSRPRGAGDDDVVWRHVMSYDITDANCHVACGLSCWHAGVLQCRVTSRPTNDTSHKL